MKKYTLNINGIVVDTFDYYKEALAVSRDLCINHNKFCNGLEMHHYPKRRPLFTIEVKYNEAVIDSTCVYD